MAYYGDSHQQFRSTFIIIGDNTVTTDGSTIYTNPPPEIGVNYYVFIRLYSSIDVSDETLQKQKAILGYLSCTDIAVRDHP